MPRLLKHSGRCKELESKAWLVDRNSAWKINIVENIRECIIKMIRLTKLKENSSLYLYATNILVHHADSESMPYKLSSG